jgi:hypothetical protein
MEGATLVYSYTGKLNVTKGQGTATYDISMIKNSTTVNGKTLFEGINKNNISITFQPDGSANNTAIRERVTSDINGSFKVEIAPGRYNISVNQTITEDNVNYTYRFSASNVEILLMDSFEYNINLTREAIK